MKYRAIGALLVLAAVLLAGCQVTGGEDSDDSSPYPTLPAPSARDADLAESLAESYILYSDEFAARYHPGFVRLIDAALCSAKYYRPDGTAGWEVYCWLALNDDPIDPDFPRRTVHPMSLFVADETFKVTVTD